MKLKGIKPVEQHVEKIVIAIAGVAGLALLGYQFFRPATMKVGPKEVTLSEAYSPAIERASVVESAMNSASPALPQAPDVFNSDKMAIGLLSVPGPKPIRVSLGDAPQFGKAAADAGIVASEFKSLEIPVPTGVVSGAFRSTISPIEKVRNPELAKLLPTEQPFDKAAVSVEATFNGVALRELLAADPDGDGPQQPIPLGWWRDTANETIGLVDIIAVEVERKTLRNADGSFPSTQAVTVIQVPPGRVSGIKLWNETVKSLGDVPPLLDQFKLLEEEIQRPEYYSTIAGPAWKPPSEMFVSPDVDAKARRINDLKRRVADLDARILELQDKARTGTAGDSRDRRESAPPVRGAGGGGGGGKGGAGPSSPSPQAPGRTEPANTRSAIERQIEARKADRERLIKQLSDLGEQVADNAADATTPAASQLPLFENAEVKLYAHDLTVEPGAAYAYRVRVVVNNPLYGRNLQDSQKALAEKSLLPSGWSEWSTPVDVDPNEFFFITSADQRSDINTTPKASAEMYVFYYGYYRVANVSLEPGDKLEGTARLPELKLADMPKLETIIKEQGDLTIAADPAVTNPSADPRLTPGGGRGGAKGGGGGGGRTPPTSERDVRGLDRDEREVQAGTDPSSTTPEWMSIAADKQKLLKVDALFLDTALIPIASQGLAGEERTRFQVLLRDRNGQVIVRMPDEERAQAVYKRLQSSAKDGENQGAPEIKPDAGPRRPRTERERPLPPAQRQQGGGGGG